MEFLIDTNVLSEMSKGFPDQRVDGWLDRFEPMLVTTDLVLGEIEYGISLKGDGPERQKLERWGRLVLKKFEGSIYRFDTRVAFAWGRYRAEWEQAKIDVPIVDGMIAAIARFHGLTVATRNVADFSKAGCEVVNPFEE